MAVTIFGFPTSPSYADSILGGINAAQQIQQQRLNNQFLPQFNNARLAMMGAQTTGQNLQNQFYPQRMQSELALNQARLTGQNLENQYYPTKTQAQLALTNAQAADYRRLAAGGGAEDTGSFKIVNTPGGVYKYNTKTGEASLVTDASGQPLMPLVKGGLQIAQTPGGGWTITEGGLNPLNPPSNQSPTQVTGANQLPSGQSLGQLQTTPSSPHSKFSNAGSTLYDPTTGNYVSTPTNATVGRMQRAMVGEYTAVPALYEILRSVAPLQGVKNLPKRWTDYVENAMGANVPEYQAYQGALKGLVPQTAEALVNAYGLNSTNENVNKIIDSIKPEPNQNPYSYAYQIAQSLGNLVMKEQAFKQFLKHGIDLQSVPPKDQLHTVVQNIYGDLLQMPGFEKGPNGPTAASSQVSRGTLAIPKFNNSNEFRTWYQSLSPADREVAYQRIKSQEKS